MRANGNMNYRTRWLHRLSLFIIGICLIPGMKPTLVSAQWATSGNDIFNTNPGNVAIGTTSPSYLLDIKGSTSLGTFRAGPDPADATKAFVDINQFGTLAIRLPINQPNFLAFGGIGLGDAWGRIGFGLDNGFPWLGFGPGNVTRDAWLYRRNGDFTFEFGTSPVEKMRVTALGNVGIGTTAPTTRLHVVGDVTVTGNIAAKYQDVAEWVVAERAIPPGTVLVLDTEAVNQVRPSSHAYDMRVAGVISETPGILLGEAGDGKVKVATTGRVKAKADASRRPIRVGDLLVTSDREGMAMRSEPLDFHGIPLHRPGTIIGKALEPLSEGHGEILILLSLQ